MTQASYTVPAGVPATPAVTFTYGTTSAANNNGRLTAMTDGSGSESYAYDNLGRVTQLTKTIAGVVYPIVYQYNQADEQLGATYPSGRMVAQNFDAIGRLSQIQSSGTNYFTINSADYNAAFLPAKVTYGNGVQGSFGYNARLQLASLAYSSGGATLFSQSYAYGTGNNGQIQSITDNVDATRTTTYAYDAWGRLKMASNAQWTVTETYDRFGNRKAQSGPVLNNVTPDPNTNRLTDPGYAYDAAGNMTSDGLNTMTYDAEGRMVTSAQAGTTTTYTYDGNGLRVQKQVGTATATVYVFSGSKVIAEYASGAAAASPAKEYIHSGGQLLATLSGSTTTYHHPDHLSVRVNTDANGAAIGHFHSPFDLPKEIP